MSIIYDLVFRILNNEDKICIKIIENSEIIQ